MKIEYKITRKQQAFINAKEDEVLYGGAAGGGKSYGQIIDAFLKALKYPGIKQIIFRNSYPELNRSIILTAQAILPKELYAYSSVSHKMSFVNGSLLEFGYLSSDSDVSNYQSAEYDIIRFDELTHFTEYQYKYMRSRLRGANKFPKQIKSSTNPGGRGHAWVKEMFITPKAPGKSFERDGTSFLFIPAKVSENKFLMKNDPGYVKRLESLPFHEKKALLLGDWDIFDGQFFPELKNIPEHYEDRIGTHIIAPFIPPSEWTIYRSFDFGYARPFSVAWWAVDYDGRLYRIMELYGCARDSLGAVMANTGVKWTPEKIFARVSETEKSHPWLKGKDIFGVADPSIWDKSRGTSVADVAESFGVYFEKGDNNRLPGWMQLHYRLQFDEEGIPMMYIFSNCEGFIRTMPSLVFSKNNPEDLDTEGEDHIADEVRYMCMHRPIAPTVGAVAEVATFDPLSDDRKIGQYNFFMKKYK
ncbi:MAG: phage terminase large subunit [Clostridia bacterium]|nr:phage terminase large subunit [Clostridia bacterium]